MKKIIELNEIKNALSCINSDTVFIAETDTVPGLFCMANSSYGCKKIFNIKKRSKIKKLSLTISINQLKNLRHFIKIDDTYSFENIIKAYSGYKITLIMKFSKCFVKEFGISNHCYSTYNDFIICGIRIPRNNIFEKIYNDNNLILASTSVNITNKKDLTNYKEISKMIINSNNNENVEYYFCEKKQNSKILEKQPSAIIDITSKELKIKRFLNMEEILSIQKLITNK